MLWSSFSENKKEGTHKFCIKSPCTSISASSPVLTVHGLLDTDFIKLAFCTGYTFLSCHFV